MAGSPKIALVTGANKGIGFAIVQQLARLGMTVYLGSRDLDRGKQAAQKLAAEGLVVPIALDVTSAASIAGALATIEQQSGRLDILINNAGITRGWTKPSENTLDDLRAVYETNVFAAVAMIQAFLPLLRKSPAGRIVNVSSSLGSLNIASDPNHPFGDVMILDYNSSKSALNAITIQFAKELKNTPIKVNSICPGYVATDLNQHRGHRTPEQGAQIAVEMATVGPDGPTGGYFDENGPIPW